MPASEQLETKQQPVDGTFAAAGVCSFVLVRNAASGDVVGRGACFVCGRASSGRVRGEKAFA